MVNLPDGILKSYALIAWNIGSAAIGRRKYYRTNVFAILPGSVGILPGPDGTRQNCKNA